MIGGNDILIPTTAGPMALDLAARATLLLWPPAVIEDAESGERLASQASIPLGTVREILIYKDDQAADRWNELGADESLVGTMIHLLVSNKSLMIVTDAEPPPEIESLVDFVRKVIARNLVNPPAGNAA